MLFFSLPLLVSFSGVLSVNAVFHIHPGGHGLGGSFREHSGIKLAVAKPPGGATNLAGNSTVFNSSSADIAGVVNKFSNAADYIQGNNISQQPVIPFAALYPPFEDPALVSPYIVSHEASNPQNPLALGYAQQPLTDFTFNGLDLAYYGQMNFGSPPQTLSIDIDTASSDLWVISNCPGSKKPQYSPYNSTSYNAEDRKFSISYQTGHSSGMLVQDVVSIGDLTVPNQTFAAATRVSKDFNAFPMSGILGMAFSSISNCECPTFFENLMAGNQIAAPFFSVYVTRGSQGGSEVCFGCFDVTKARGEVIWIPVVSQTYWTVPMNAIIANNRSSIETDIIAVLDTGSTMIYLPQSVAEAMYSKIPGARAADEYGQGYFTYPCGSDLEVSFILGESVFGVDPSDLNAGKVSANSTLTGYVSGWAATCASDCIGGVLSLGEGFPTNIAILGDAFLKSWYAVFDYSNGARVGLARSMAANLTQT